MNPGHVWFFIREYLFPHGCGICGRILINRIEAWYGLCDECRAKLNRDDSCGQGCCDLCGRPLISENQRCLSCRENTETPFYHKMFALFPYTGIFRRLLGAFKFGKSLGAGHFLADKLLEALNQLPLEEMENPVLIPVPPRPGKIRKTGWDQMESLSRLIEPMLRKQHDKSPALRRCLRRQASQTQKKLDRKGRRTNLKGRISARGKVPKDCILFDDVITTGSTINACAAALKEAGAERIFGICLFYD